MKKMVQKKWIGRVPVLNAGFWRSKRRLCVAAMLMSMMFAAGMLHAVEIDDFEGYADSAALQSAWNGVINQPVSVTLSSSAAVGSNAMSMVYSRVVGGLPVTARKAFPSSQDWSSAQSLSLRARGFNTSYSSESLDFTIRSFTDTSIVYSVDTGLKTDDLTYSQATFSLNSVSGLDDVGFFDLSLDGGSIPAPNQNQIIVDAITLNVPPTLNSPPANNNGISGGLMPIQLDIPGQPAPGSISLAFHPAGGGAPTAVLTLTNQQGTISFPWDIGTDPTALPQVTASTASSLPDGTYDVVVSYTNVLSGVDMADTNVNVTVDTAILPPNLIAPAAGSDTNVIPIQYTLPEPPASGSVKLRFTSAGFTNELTMINSTNVSTTWDPRTNPADLPEVQSATATNLRDGQYEVRLRYSDQSGNGPASDTHANVRIEAVTDIPVMQSPAAGMAYSSPLPIEFTLGDEPLPGSAELSFSGPTNGTLALATTNSGTTSFNLDVTDPAASPEVDSGDFSALPDGVYNLTLRYQNSFGAPAATAQVASVTVDTVTQPPTLTSPSNNANVAVFDLNYSLPEDALTNSVQLTFASPAGTNVLTLTNLSAGSASFTWDPATDPALLAQVQSATANDLLDGVYDVTLRYRDAAGNTSASDLVTNVTLYTPGAGRGTPFVVDTLLDENDGFDVNGVSLREAVTSGERDFTITFDPGLYGGTIVLTNGQIAITKGVTIHGPDIANGISVSGNGQSRIFYIQNEIEATLANITLTNGAAINGGAIQVAGSSSSGSFPTTLIMSNVVATGNSATSDGGAIHAFNIAAVRLHSCSLIGNVAGFSGGAIRDTSDALTIENSTIVHNMAVANGGGLHMADNYSLANITVMSNSADEGGGVYSGSMSGGTTEIQNTIITRNTATTQGDNVYDPFSSINFLGQNLTNGNPGLAPLGYYGGLTPTMPPVPGSPAIDPAGGATNSALSVDQRGEPRVVNGVLDIGAVEYQAAADDLVFWDTDWDNDGEPYGMERTLGADPFQDDTGGAPFPVIGLFTGRPTLFFGFGNDRNPHELVVEWTTNLTQGVYTQVMQITRSGSTTAPGYMGNTFSAGGFNYDSGFVQPTGSVPKNGFYRLRAIPAAP